ncbi:Hypothetical protein PACV_261 [Pacmanvirus A23]|uniref:Hypothetical protein n=1 Tax=Pacmanvirus A23 TaxID=1932881 RepID=UPI000A094FC3|nr:Hypothetical protein B9W72_gp259 [Pacmanvirus A23]SIP85976.1 Hypothetical protein PACV_261 [Pacmanvirus A23]
MLKLKGHFSYIDKYSKLKFLWLDDESKAKLARQAADGNKPFDDEGFSVSLSKSIKAPPDDIKAMVGLECDVYIRLNRYNFISKLGKNKGDRVSGTQLILVNLESTQNKDKKD